MEVNRAGLDGKFQMDQAGSAQKPGRNHLCRRRSAVFADADRFGTDQYFDRRPVGRAIGIDRTQRRLNLIADNLLVSYQIPHTSKA